MKVSSKIISGFLTLMLLALVVLLNQLSVIHQMQAVNRDLSELNMNSATTVLKLKETADNLSEDSQKYLVGLGPSYGQQVLNLRQDFLETLTELRKTAHS